MGESPKVTLLVGGRHRINSGLLVQIEHFHYTLSWGGREGTGKAWVLKPALPSPSGVTPGKKRFYFFKPQFPSL